MSSLEHNLKRLEEIKNLKEGWYYDSKAVSSYAVENVKRFLEIVQTSSPTVFPMPDGGVTLEWVSPDNHFVAIDFFVKEDPEHCHGNVFVLRENAETEIEQD